ncbi:Nn.00g113220.m01.CDS01 [Neocucurbitaria sp. VM-36]
MKLASKGTPSRSEIILPGSIPASKQDSISDLLPPPLDDEISYDGSNNGEDDDEPIPDGIPTHLKEKDEFKTKMRLILLRTLLTRCEVLLSIVHELERKPWAYDATKPPYYYYSKIRNFAYRARRLAEALESRDLQARCEYWAGRGCGGTRDWHAASQHFALAIKLDVENDTFPSGRTKKRALRPNEKEDVHFLLESVTRRHERWLRDTADARGAAQYESEFTGKRIEECINWDSMDSPTWLPERDRVVQIWKREGRTGKKKGGTVEDLGDDRECDDIEEKRKQDNKYEQDLTRREFSAQERHYILHGDSQTAKRKEKIKLKQPPKPILETSNPIPNPSINHSCKTQASTSSSLSSLNPSLTLSSSTNPTPTPPPPPTLEHELNQAGWTSLTPTPTPPLSYSTPSPPAVPLNLKERRNLTIQPIQTNYMRQQGDSGEAEQEHEPKSQGEMFDGIGYEYEYEYGNGGYGGYGGPRSAPPFRTRATDSPKGTPQSGATTPCTPLLSHQRGSPWSRRGREGRMQGVRAATMSARIGGMVGLGWVDENEEV